MRVRDGSVQVAAPRDADCRSAAGAAPAGTVFSQRGRPRPGGRDERRVPRGWSLWWRWVVANIAGEVVGFGLAAGIGAAVGAALQQQRGLVAVVVAVLGAVAVGAVEGTAVGLALRASLPRITRRAWVAATVAGAIIAWGSGMAIGALAGDRLGTLAGGSPLVGALVIGAVAGAALSVFQTPVLARIVRHARWWVPAHAAAWAAGMVVAFAGMAAIPDGAPIALTIGTGALTGLGMGTLVASLTGLALIWPAGSAPARATVVTPAPR